MNSQTYRLGFIGAGKLAGSVIRGLALAKFCASSEMIASEPSEQTRADLQHDVDLVFAADNAELAEKAETILIGVKPEAVLPVLGGIADKIDNKLVISLAAGVRIASLEKLATARFMRAMTNSPAAICQAATAIASGCRTTNEDVDLARRIFSSIGVVAKVTDEQIDVATALCGSGPAFVYAVIEALASGAEKMGLAPDVALHLATQTALGAAQFARESNLSPEALRKLVVTPGGTTAAGVAEIEKREMAASLIAAVEAATKRGKAMAQENF